MRRLTWINLGLALLVGALAWLLLAKPESDSKDSFALSQLQATQIQQITLSNPNLPRLVLRKQAQHWHITEPLAARADAIRVDSLLGLLSARSEKRLAATDLGRFALDQPFARITLDAQEFFFGGNNPVSNQIYVLTQNQVYLLSPVYLADAVKPLTTFVDKSLLGPEEIPVGFAFPHVQLQRDNGVWRSSVTHPKFSQDTANAYADLWRHALASEVMQTTTLSHTNTLRITLQSGKIVALRYARQGKDWMLQRDDAALIYHFSERDGNALLSPIFAPRP